MRTLLSNLGAAILLIAGRRVEPERLSNSAASAAVLIVILAVIGGISTFAVLHSVFAVTIIPLFAVLAAFTVCAVAIPSAATGRAIIGVLSVFTISAGIAMPLLNARGSPTLYWTSLALLAAGCIGLVVGTWRLIGLLGGISRAKRGGATLVAFLFALIAVNWFYVSTIVSRPFKSVQTETPSDYEIQSARFDDLPVTEALIDQRPRLAARIAALPPHRDRESFVLAVGGSGYQAILDREARRAAGVLNARDGGPALVVSNSPDQVKTGLLASPATVGLAIAAIGHRAVRSDTLVIYLASHGGREANIAMDAPRLEFADLTAKALAGDLQRAGIERRIIIVSACFGASWIKPLASPSTILMTASDVDKTSFGCDDSRDLTVFGEAILRELGNHHQSLATAFAHAKVRIAESERTDHTTASLPQSYVGSEMTEAWTASR